MSFQKILDKYREIAFSEKDKGNRFERLMQAYLKTDPRYSSEFKRVWLWQEFPYHLTIGANDTGIDIVALTNNNEYWAIQCKCYAPNAIIDKASVDTFLSTSGRSFIDDGGKKIFFSQRLWIETTGRKWSANAEDTIRNQQPQVTRINLFDLIESSVDWEKLEEGVHGELARRPKKTLEDKRYSHQREARDKTHEYFKQHDRGKLIMACGTGKTFTSLRIAENETAGKGLILFLVPSIALLGQTLREWSNDAKDPINAICICSDSQISVKKIKNDDSDGFSIVDLAWPASTNADYILQQFENIRLHKKNGLTVVFSTYQSIEVISQAQKVLLQNNFPEFDLIICDEAHRTTGLKLPGFDESAFTKVHDAEFIKAKKRLYMTATPRMYDDAVKSKAAQNETPLWSMDHEDQFGREIYRIGFGEAVERGLLTDYKVLILTLNDQDVPEGYRRVLANEQVEINTDDATKIIGTINALSKQFLGDDGNTKNTDPEVMRRAVAFCPSIAGSKEISETYNVATATYLNTLPAEIKDQMVTTTSRHMDGSMTAPEREDMLSWLKAESEGRECRVITNVKVLSEGVDVPSLDAVLFLSARNSQVDVVQSVGRVMRKAPGKKYGYIIIPIVVPSDIEPENALNDNQRYKVVWTVLNALRAHDDRFNATINKIDLNRKKPDNISVVSTLVAFQEDDQPIFKDARPEIRPESDISRQLAIQFQQLQETVYGRIVKKVGDRGYWEQWAKEVAVIAERQVERIQYLIDFRKGQRKAFEEFLAGLQKNINPGITEAQAVDMLAQHMITRPIFEVLFEGYSFVKNNAVSAAMQGMLDKLEGESLADDSDTLQKFYESVRKKAQGIDNAEGKQRIIVELYDKFFKTAFPKLVQQLGIVYTPIEIVDFIIQSVNDVLIKEFNCTVSDKNVHLLDPFTGTGTFVTRLLQSGLIETKDLARKYRQELHANEYVLLAYYIAAVNIENVFHDKLLSALFDSGEGEVAYEPFEGIVLTDTFQLGETDESEKLFSEMFPQNSVRVQKQQNAPLRVIVGNPPYSIGQKSANDNAQNQKYNKLDQRIADTYTAASSASLAKSSYDGYIRAFRWSTDRLSENGGIVAFVSNGKWLDAQSSDGFRRTIEKEFTSIYVFDLRGDQRGDWRKEGAKIFGEGSQNRIAITLLVKKPHIEGKANIFYHDIGDNINRREDKLRIISDFGTVANPKMSWTKIEPNEQGDWLAKRTSSFDGLVPMAPEKNFDKRTEAIFTIKGPGISTGRDSWVFNSGIDSLLSNMGRMIVFYNQQRNDFQNARELNHDLKVEDFLSQNEMLISWTRSLRNNVIKNVAHELKSEVVYEAMYRPFTKQKLYYDRNFLESPGLWRSFFPEPSSSNLIITVSGRGSAKDFTCLVSDTLVCYDFIDKTQCFPLYYYESQNSSGQLNAFDSIETNPTGFVRQDGISDNMLLKANKQYGAKNISKEDIFFYIYGFLHNREYRKAFSTDLKMMSPRILLVDDIRDFWQFSKAGRKLAELHLTYEKVADVSDMLRVTIDGNIIQDLTKLLSVGISEPDLFRVEKIRFSKKDNKDKIIFNSRITISDIPDNAYQYKLNGRSAIEWLIDQYQISTAQKSRIINNPNEWSIDADDPTYILRLLLNIIQISVQTVTIVESLPVLSFDTDNGSTEELKMSLASQQFGYHPDLEVVSQMLYKHLEDKQVDYFMLSDLEAVASAAGVELDDVLAVVGLWSLPGNGILKQVFETTIDGSSISNTEVQHNFNNYWKNGSMKEDEWKQWAAQITVKWKVQQQHNINV